MLSPRFAERLLFFPPRRDPGPVPRLHGVSGQDVELTADDGTSIHAWWFGASVDAPAVLFLHGNASQIGDLGYQAEGMLREGISVLLLSYRGYGRSEGRPSEEGVTLDAAAAMAWVAERVGGAGRVVVHGRSLGGAVAGRLLEHGAGPAGVIVESTFTDLFGIARSVYPFVPEFLLGRLRGRFDTRRALSGSAVPTLVVHGTADELVPISMAYELLDASGEQGRMMEVRGAAHNDLPFVAGSHYFGEIAGFVRRVTGRTPV